MTCPPPAEQPTKRRRVAKDATARFNPDDVQALAAAEANMPQEHLARWVRKLHIQAYLEGYDLGLLMVQFDGLGALTVA